MPDTGEPKPFDIEAVRRDFPILHKPLPKDLPLVYLDNGASAQKPQVVIDKEVEVYENYFANAYRGKHYFGARIDEELERSRAIIQQFLGAETPEEIIFTAGATMSINLVASGWGRKNLQPGDEILLTIMEHHANIVPWQQIATQTGAVVHYIPITADGLLDLSQIDSLLTEKTKMLAVTGMSNVLGTINPIGELTRRAKACGAIVLVDGAQSVPHIPTDVQSSGIDFLAFSGHKLYGPTGVGVLYGKRHLLNEMDPFLTGGHMIERVYKDHSTWAEPPAKFEAGTLPIAQAIALGTAVEYLSGIGFSAFHEHETQLLEYAHRRLADVPGVKIYGPNIANKGSIVSFTVEGAHPEDLAMYLDRKGVFIRHGHHCTMLLHDCLGVSATVRASFGIYNQLSDVDALCEGLEFARQKLRLT